MKKKTKRLISILLLLGLISGLMGCGQETSANVGEAVDAGGIVIRLGVQPGVAVSEVSQYTGILEDYLAEKDIQLQYVEFTYGPSMVESLAADEIDIALMGNLPVFTGVSNGTDLKVIYLTLLTENGLNGIIAGPDSGIKSIADLKGKNVGVPIGSAAHLGLELLLNTEDLTLDDVNLVNIEAADMATSLSNEEIDAAALWETNLTKAALRSGGTIIATSKSVMEDQTFAVASEKFLSENPEMAADFVAGLIQVEDYIVDNPDESVEGILERTGDSAEEWNYVYGLSKASGFTDDTYETARLAKDFLERNDLIQNDFDYETIFDQSYWDEAVKLLEE
ncbi:MAG: ABC transporter substrate-binding protein [Clostridia bacterium]|nr:ABC transporter substrate-binding protein [Clostridia bacterium]